eukprot:CAMPEP_0171463004 /NCGR_PEP_ID=MMETSP0945-20130129/6826_1 /TAXON_ID=109269 /ORGANISM="Vaucheria litorea, Strain CCMP2940" /LENGTH=379 /DNA_ID=CAMNT_0011989665 /DNA_START=176 /DNA_END=1315 /DNA_ORIENTATION=-
MDEYDDDLDEMGESESSEEEFEENEIELDEDIEDLIIKPGDTVLLASSIDDDQISNVMVYIYDSCQGIIYVHHDFMLPSLPLCMSWINLAPTQFSGDVAPLSSFVAIGMFQPGIEIWNLDVIETFEARAVLGGYETGLGKGSDVSEKRSKHVAAGSHTSEVIGLSWNGTQRQVLASGGGDSLVKVWDITTQQCSADFTHHNDKVQHVRWHHAEPYVMASASSDKRLAIFDVRTPGGIISLDISGESECLEWDLHNGAQIVSGTEDGFVSCHDIRKGNGSKPVFRFKAHEYGLTDASFCPNFSGLLATSSEDKTVRLWDVSKAGPNCEPVNIAEKNLKVGSLYTVRFYADMEGLLAAAGDEGSVALWHVLDDVEVKKRWG